MIQKTMYQGLEPELGSKFSSFDIYEKYIYIFIKVRDLTRLVMVIL